MHLSLPTTRSLGSPLCAQHASASRPRRTFWTFLSPRRRGAAGTLHLHGSGRFSSRLWCQGGDLPRGCPCCPHGLPPALRAASGGDAGARWPPCGGLDLAVCARTAWGPRPAACLGHIQHLLSASYVMARAASPRHGGLAPSWPLARGDCLPAALSQPQPRLGGAGRPPGLLPASSFPLKGVCFSPAPESTESPRVA